MAIMRAFIAIKIPADIQKKLQGIQDTLKKSAAQVSWVHPENIHLTLKFLGNIEEAQVDDIVTGLRNSLKGIAPFQLQVGYAGAFPNIRFPRVLWVGISDDESDSLKTLHTGLSSNLAQIGFEAESERFQPHLTLGRVRAQKNRSNLLRSIESIVNIWVGEVSVQSVYLMTSELRSIGAEYTDLAEVGLG